MHENIQAKTPYDNQAENKEIPKPWKGLPQKALHHISM